MLRLAWTGRLRLSSMDNVLNKLIRSFFMYIKKDISDSSVESFIQFIKFGIVGLSNTIIAYAINVAVLLALKSSNVSWDYYAGNIVSFLLSVLWSFYWNNRFVFTLEEGQTRVIWKSILRTYISYGITGIVLNNILSWIWIEILGVSKYVAPMFNLLISVPINFFINKIWAFSTEE